MTFSHYRLFPFELAELALFDVGVRFSLPAKEVDHRAIVVEIDNKSVDELGSWPWPRGLMEKMVDSLRGRGVKVIGLYLPFIEEERAPGLREVQAFRESFEAYSSSRKEDAVVSHVQKGLEGLEETLASDRRLVESVELDAHVVLPVFDRAASGWKSAVEGDDSVLHEDFLTHKEIPEDLKARHSVDRFFLPFPELAKAAAGLGHSNLISRGGMGGRSHPLYAYYKGSLMPSFPLRLAIAYLGEEPEGVLVEEGEVRLKGESIPTYGGEILIKFNKGQVGFSRYSFSDVLKAKDVQPLFSGKVALVALNLQGGNTIPTPIKRDMSEADFAAWILDSILNKNIIVRPPYMDYIELMAMILFGMLTLFILPRMGAFERLGAVLVLAVLTLMTGFILLSLKGLWVRSGYIAACTLTIYVVVSLWRFITVERPKRESLALTRSLGLGMQNQGLLDPALEQFKKLPLDGETKDFIYNLGLAYEKKRMIDKALSAYEYIFQAGPFRDLDERITWLRESDRSSTIGSHDGVVSGSFLDDLTEEEITHVGRYEILGIIGRGSMGHVYKALDPRINRLLAIKTIRFSDEFDEDVIQEIKERFLREAEIAGRLSHRSIVTIYDMGEDRDLTYMAMEYLDGYDLEKFITKENLLPLRRILFVIAGVADALDFAHKAHVIHRDIKPANIMLLKRGGIKVTDFGIAKAITSSRTKAGVILGTPNYMSPEQIMGQKIDLRSDIFSLGVLFFQLLTGELPFHGDTLSSLLYQITQMRHPELHCYNPKIPKPFVQIVDKALAKDPNDRFQSAGQMCRAVRILAGKMDQIKKREGAKEGLAPRP